MVKFSKGAARGAKAAFAAVGTAAEAVRALCMFTFALKPYA